jgi:hypothetical protein
MGWMDEKGNIDFQEKPAAFINTVGKNAISYPASTKPVPVTIGTKFYILKDDRLRQVKTLDALSIQPASEYDITQGEMGLMRGRYVEGKIDFTTTDTYTPDIIRNVKGMPVTLGQGKATSQVIPVEVEDIDTGERISMSGETTVMTSFDNLKILLEAEIPDLKVVHDKLDSMTFPASSQRRTYGLSNVSESTRDVIMLTNDMDIKDLDPNAWYSWGNKIKSGRELQKQQEVLNNKK